MSDFTIIDQVLVDYSYELVNKNNTVEIYEEGDYLDEKYQERYKRKFNKLLEKFCFTPVFGKTNLVILVMGVGGSTLINGGGLQDLRKIIKNWINEHNFEISDIEKLENVFN